jgi:glycosyltransferase involved in cell wall biosynthesis
MFIMKEGDLDIPVTAIVSNAISGGGAEKSMLALHQSFLKSGMKSNLIALNQSINPQTVPYVTELNRNWRSGLIGTWCNYLDFKKLIKTINPDVLILNCELPELYGAILSHKCKIICVEHTTKPWHGKKFLGIFVRLLLRIKKVDWVTVVNSQEKIWHGKPVIAHLPNPFINHLSESRPTEKNSVLTFVGGLKPNKHPEWVIKTGLSLELPVHIFGDGVLRTQLESRYQKHSGQINFFGFLPNPWSVISPNSLIIVPSEYEGDGMVVVEAVLSGNPTLLRDNEDLRRFGFEDKHYFKNVEDLALTVRQNLETRFKNLVVSQSKTKDLQISRSLQRITDCWINLICTLYNSNSLK